MPESNLTELVQLPAIKLANGRVENLSADLVKLTYQQLKAVAELMGGTVVWVKYRAVYSELETSLCERKDCWRPDNHEH